MDICDKMEQLIKAIKSQDILEVKKIISECPESNDLINTLNCTEEFYNYTFDVIVLNIAIKYSTYEIVKFLLENGAESSLFEPNFLNYISIDYAALHGSIEHVKLILEYSNYYFENNCTYDGDTTLHLACDNHEILEFLLENGGYKDVDAINSSGESLLCLACRNSNIKSMKILL